MGDVEYPAGRVAIARFQRRLKTERSLQRKSKPNQVDTIVEYLDLTPDLCPLEVALEESLILICKNKRYYRAGLLLDLFLAPLKGSRLCIVNGDEAIDGLA
jgi:hypothetical protein